MELPKRNNEPVLPFTISNGEIFPRTRIAESQEVLAASSEKHVKSASSHGPALDHPTNYLESLMHLLKGNIGSGVFAMGDAFKNGGIILGTLLTLYLGLICVHCQHILLNCSRKVKEKLNLEEDPDFAETVELCFENGPSKLQKFSRASKVTVNVFICVTQLGFCCVYFVFSSSNLNQILTYYGFDVNLKMTMLFVLLPMLLPSLIRNLKLLAPFSAVANVCMAGGIGVVFYYVLQDVPSISHRNHFGQVSTLPLYFGTAMFAFEGIALVLPLKNAMKKPEQFGSAFGVLNVGMILTTLLYTSFGFFGYLKFGDNVAGSVTLNLPQDEILAQVVKIAVGIGMCLTYPLQLFVAIQIMWPNVQQKFGPFQHSASYELLFRTFMVFVTFVIAELVPHLNIFISLIGALCSTALALVFPPLIQLTLAYGSSEGPSRFVIMKNGFILVFSLFGFVTGTYESIRSLIDALFHEQS
ncbi:Proton-coupled amino acid transporter-like protein [Pseudolycoriella hygida]|uniref:Proton-coupled amino acid transporter-like protein n=1 Tax=Pseudolycoriella hygida TaxID=35572 RepID=A0A9Q0MUQ2_9DIPT|nr:Proton-coupled amino acid transporter-like protein [Pseudolycoriella hygida]